MFQITKFVIAAALTAIIAAPVMAQGNENVPSDEEKSRGPIRETNDKEGSVGPIGENDPRAFWDAPPFGEKKYEKIKTDAKNYETNRPYDEEDSDDDDSVGPVDFDESIPYIHEGDFDEQILGDFDEVEEGGSFSPTKEGEESEEVDSKGFPVYDEKAFEGALAFEKSKPCDKIKEEYEKEYDEMHGAYEEYDRDGEPINQREVLEREEKEREEREAKLEFDL